MKKNFNFAFAALAAFAMVLSCSKVDELGGVQNPSGETSGQITISATLSDALTKVAFTPSYGTDGKPESLALAWEAGDKLRVYDHADKTKYEDFELTAESVGQKTGCFTGVLPVAESYDVEVINGEVDYAVQIQPADGVTSSLKYLASASAVADIKALTFTDYSSVLAVTAKLPEGVAAVVGSVDITADEAIFNTGKTLTISLAEKGDAGEDGILHLFANLPQGDTQIPEGTTLLVRFNAPDTDHTVYTRFVELGAQTFSAGKLNTVNINATETDIHAGVVASDGSSVEKAYLIGDKYQMQAMGGLMTADATTYFKMVADVDLAGVNWTPLNNVSPYDKAINFDGGAHTISNLVVGGTVAFPSFVGNLNGSVNNVTFDKADVTVANSEYKGGVVAGSIGNEDNAGNCSKVIISNSKVTSSSNMSGALAALANHIGTLSECAVVNTSVTGGARSGGLIGSVAKSDVITNCYAENVTVTSSSYYAGGLIGQFSGGGEIKGCYTTGTVNSTPTNYSRSGGLVGYLISGTVSNCHSTCDVTVGGLYGGGLIGDVDGGTVTQCYATGKVSGSNHYCGGLIGHLTGSLNISESYFAGSVTLPSGSTGKAQAGGIISHMDSGSSAEISNCYSAGSISGRRWHGGIVGGTDANAVSLKVTNCYTTTSITGTPYGALVGSCSMEAANVTCAGFIAYWPSGKLDKDSKITSTSYYIGQASSISAKAKEFNWDETIWDLSGEEPRLRPCAAPDDAVIEWPDPIFDGAEVVNLCNGVEWTSFHGLWEGQIRNINIVKTRLNSHNRLGIYYEYGADDDYLPKKCEYLDALVGTNGPMACCHFVKVDGTVKRVANAQDPWIANCALTIDNNVPDIVKVADNYAAAELPNRTVGTGGPLLVWDGEIQTYDQYEKEDTDAWLTTTHPRTALGLTKDRKTVIQVTVDGRWEGTADKTAVGMSVSTLAKLMKELGCDKALNFDGGGGTAMWVYGYGVNGIVNHPCESPKNWDNPTLRTTGNAVYIYSDLK